MEGTGVELKADNGKDDDGEEHEEGYLEQWRHGLDDGHEHHLQTCNQPIRTLLCTAPANQITALALRTNQKAALLTRNAGDQLEWP